MLAESGSGQLRFVVKASETDVGHGGKSASFCLKLSHEFGTPSGLVSAGALCGSHARRVEHERSVRCARFSVYTRAERSQIQRVGRAFRKLWHLTTYGANRLRFTFCPERAVQLNEVYLKCLFLEHLRGLGRLGSDSVLASEFALGRAGRRIDLAIWSGEFVGIEFKSKFDSLKRLSWQLDAYLQCFDRIILVVDQKHAPKVATFLPAAVEFWVVDSNGNFVLKNAAGILRDQTVEGLANLCTLADLRRLSTAPSSDRPNRGRSSILAGGLNAEDVYDSAINRFRRTFAGSSREFWNVVGDQPIRHDALPSLSRFAKQRSRLASIQEAEATFWRDWGQPLGKLVAVSAEANV